MGPATNGHVMGWGLGSDIILLISRTVPALATVLLAFAGMALLTGFGFGAVAPPLVLPAIFFWRVHRPQLLPVWLAFLFGVVFDIVAGTPLGQWGLACVLAAGLATSQRVFPAELTFPAVWFGFAVAAMLAAMVGWFFVSLADLNTLPVWPVMKQTLLMIASYPVVAILLGQVQRMLLPAER